jgi:hypothetical protein
MILLSFAVIANPAPRKKPIKRAAVVAKKRNILLSFREH